VVICKRIKTFFLCLCHETYTICGNSPGQAWPSYEPWAASSPSVHFKHLMQLPELVLQAACEQHFILFTNISDT